MILRATKKKKMNIEKFIAEEKLYFEPMLQRQNRYSNAELENFRDETVSERKSRVSKEIFEYCNGVVKHGPFTGLKLTSNTWWGGNDLGSMCFGLYEKELLEFLNSKYLENRDIFIDIGAADGYYAIGLLMSKSVKSALCFELTPEGRDTINFNWNLNDKPGVIEIKGDVFTDFKNSVSYIDFKKTTVLIDIEGSEFSFLNNEILKILQNAVVIIEIHNWIPNFIDLYSEFLKNASEIFDIEILTRQERETLIFDELLSLTDDNRLLLTSESRPCVMRFLVLKPKSNMELE
jgi:hypothetical protein